MTTIVAILLLVALAVTAVGAALFVRWLSRAWTVIEEDDLHRPGPAGSIWQRLGEWVGRGPRRLTYRRDVKGRFRKYRR